MALAKEEAKNGGRPQNIGYHPSTKGNYFAKIQSSRGPSAWYQRFQRKTCRQLLRSYEKVSTIPRRATFCPRAEEEKANVGDLKKWKNGRSPNALSHEQLANCADLVEANMEFARKQAWELHKNIYKIKETYIQACELKRQLSHLGQIVRMKRRIHSGQRRFSPHVQTIHRPPQHAARGS